MGRHDLDTDADEQFYAERLQAEGDSRERLLAPLTRWEWYGSLAVAVGVLLLALVIA